jgi:hypothetical protein
MPNPNPNTKGLVKLDSKRAREIASKPRLKEKTVKKQITLFESQIAWLAENVENDSALIRQLLDQHMKNVTP